jgi:hypothetical protein
MVRVLSSGDTARGLLWWMAYLFGLAHHDEQGDSKEEAVMSGLSFANL